MRALALLLVLLLAAPLAEAAHGNERTATFHLAKPDPVSAAIGETVRIPITAAHICRDAQGREVEGEVYFLAEAPPGVTVGIANGTWGPCERDNFRHAHTTLSLRASENTSSGVHAVGVAAVWFDPDRRAERVAVGFEFRIPYVGRAVLTGPPNVLAVAGVTRSVALNVSVEANGDTRLAFQQDVPSRWHVAMTTPVLVKHADLPRTQPWVIRITPPADARGDHRIGFRVVPTDAIGGVQQGSGSDFTLLVRLPTNPGTNAPTTPTTPVQDDGRPPVVVADTGGAGEPDRVPLYAMLLILASIGALWWARRGR